MRIFIIWIFNFFLLSGILAQDMPGADPRLNVRFSQSQIQQWEQNNSSRLALFEFELDHGYDIQTFPEEKIQDIPYLCFLDYETKTKGEKVQSVNENDFNLFLYDYERNRDRDKLYRIAGTNQVLMIYSNRKFVNMFNESRGYDN
jgi:hypothetical protein